MARTSYISAALVLVAVMLFGAVQAQVFDQCMSYYGGLGPEGIQEQVPTCKQGLRGFRGCCNEVKQLVARGPDGCLCDDQVWEQLVHKIEEANINPGLNRDSLNMFANLCGIPHSGNGGCRRMARQRARSATRGSSSASSRTTTRSSTRN